LILPHYQLHFVRSKTVILLETKYV